MKYLFIINDGPYGNERPFNALRLALELLSRDNTEIRLFLIGDGVQCGISNQTPPKGYYNIEQMIRPVVKRGLVAT